MRQHPRVSIASQAEAEMAKAIADIASKHDLTYGELFSAMAGIQARWAQYQVRDERHPNDPDKPGGLA